eukprot:4074558-Prymnesium_polylepis.2
MPHVKSTPPILSHSATKASSNGSKSLSCAPVGSGWDLDAQPYESTPNGRPCFHFEVRSCSTLTFASAGSSWHAGTTPFRSGITSPLANLRSHRTHTSTVNASSGSSSAPLCLCSFVGHALCRLARGTLDVSIIIDRLLVVRRRCRLALGGRRFLTFSSSSFLTPSGRPMSASVASLLSPADSAIVDALAPMFCKSLRALACQSRRGCVPARDGDYAQARGLGHEVLVLIFETFGGFDQTVERLLTRMASAVGNTLSKRQYDETT